MNDTNLIDIFQSKAGEASTTFFGRKFFSRWILDYDSNCVKFHDLTLFFDKSSKNDEV